MDWLKEWYRASLGFVLDYRKTVLAAAVLIFAASLALTMVLRKEFVPAHDQSRFLVRITLPLGSSLEMTDKIFKEAEAFLLSRPEVENTFGAVGGGQVSQGRIFITMKPLKARLFRTFRFPVLPPSAVFPLSLRSGARTGISWED
ncbi:MAG: efflux RND transporter permease subunit [Candidatus Omnitrophota bacterium]